jgi:hypothetical protein
LGNIFLCFDGCAQYLTSPSAPYLIASAYQNEISGGKCIPPSLVACVRNPVDQAVSWWKFENNAISWGESMGLTEWNTSLRSNDYPPKSIGDAVKFSQSQFVRVAYTDAELLAKTLTMQQEEKNLFYYRMKRLPNWAITWPGGQLGTIGRSGKYRGNIKRFNTVFNSMLGKKNEDTTQANRSGYVHIVPIEHQSCGPLLKDAVRPILADSIVRSTHRDTKHSYSDLMASIDGAIEKFCMENNFRMSGRNAGVSLANKDLEPSTYDLDELTKYFAAESIDFEQLAK